MLGYLFLKSGLKDFLGVLCAFARDAFKFLLFDSGLSGLGHTAQAPNPISSKTPGIRFQAF
jgi:hypothetical protein